MEMKRMLYVTGLLLCTSLGGYAQEGNLIDVKVVNEEVKKQGSEVSLRMTLDLTGLRVGNQKSVCLHPAVVSADGTHEAVLAPVVVDGKTRSRVHRREKALTGASPATDNAYTVLRSGRESRVEYIAKLAYEPWMVDSRLVLRERMTGCLDCTAVTEESTVKAPFIKLFTPRYVTPFVTPEREAVKVRNEVRVARLQFRQGKSDVDPRYKDNRAELETVTGSINVVKTNPDLTITGIYITGYASPEGSVAFNQKLSESRANALAEYARKDTHMDASLWHVAGMGEDWEGLRREVEKHPQLLDIDKVLRLIDECEGDKDACEKRIRESVSPDVYTRLLNEMYGPLRRNEYKIEYSVRSFNLEEAKKQIKTRPDLLSVEEIYTVAESYGKGTADYEEALRIAAATYPKNAAAVVNAACLKMEGRDVQGAIAMLEASEVKEDGRVLNALGVAYAKQKQYDRAKAVLEQAVQAGSREARTNLEQVAGVVADL